MIYQSVQPISRSEAERIFARNDTDEMVNALLSVAYYDPDWRWIATIWPGHVGRIHAVIDWDVVMPRLVSLLDDPKLWIN